MFYFIFFAILIFGSWISYYDIKNGEIKNYSLLIFVLVSIFINIYFTKTFIELPLISFFNILLGIFLAVMIWMAGLWSAADAKLFIVINILFPVSFYKHSPGYFPGIFILINSIIPLFLFLLAQVIIKTNLREKKKALISQLKLSAILHLFLAITAIHSITFFISYFFKIRIEYLIWIVFLFFIFWFIELKLKIQLTHFFIFIIFFTVSFSFILDVPIFTVSYLLFILFLFFLISFLCAILKLSTSMFTDSIKIDKLEEGMVPAEMVMEKNKKYTKKPITFLTFLTLLKQKTRWKPLIGFNPDGLEKEEVEEIQSLYKKGLLEFEELKISTTIPFAPILFFGALLTYFLKESLLILI